MAEVSVTERTRLHGRRLGELRTRLGLTKGHLMDALGFKTTQTYDLYERGKSVIRMDRVEDWAAAFGIDPLSFVIALLKPDEIERISQGDELLENEMRPALDEVSQRDRHEVLDGLRQVLREK